MPSSRNFDRDLFFYNSRVSGQTDWLPRPCYSRRPQRLSGEARQGGGSRRTRARRQANRMPIRRLGPTTKSLIESQKSLGLVSGSPNLQRETARRESFAPS